MLHFTCDHCGRDLADAHAGRFVVKMEVFAAHDPCRLTEADLDDDPIESLAEMLQDAEDEGVDPADDLAPSRSNFRYDLCPACHQRFLRDPLARGGAGKKFHFSEN